MTAMYGDLPMPDVPYRSPAAGENAGVTANAPAMYATNDLTMEGWEIQLTHAQGWDTVQVASVNTRSHLTIEADDGNGEEQFTGWRVTLDKARLGEFIQQAQNLYARLP